MSRLSTRALVAALGLVLVACNTEATDASRSCDAIHSELKREQPKLGPKEREVNCQGCCATYGGHAKPRFTGALEGDHCVCR